MGKLAKCYSYKENVEYVDSPGPQSAGQSEWPYSGTDVGT